MKVQVKQKRIRNFDDESIIYTNLFQNQQKILQHLMILITILLRENLIMIQKRRMFDVASDIFDNQALEAAGRY